MTARDTQSFDAATGALNWTSERSPYDIMVVEGRVIGIESYGGGAFFGQVGEPQGAPGRAAERNVRAGVA